MPDIHPTKLILTILAPVVSAASGWLCAAVAKYGVHLDPTGVNSLGVAGVAVALATVAKLIHDTPPKRPAAAATTTASEPAWASRASPTDPALDQDLAGAWPGDA